MNKTAILLPPFAGAELIPISSLSNWQGAPRRAVIVCPGGAYHGLAAHEGAPVAARFDAAGIAAFVLTYTTKEGAANFAPLCELVLAIKHLRENAAAYHIDPDYIFTCGFSAGGHLAGSAGVLYDLPAVQELLERAEDGIGKPTGMILGYPVITTDEPYTHKGSFHRLCGNTEPTYAELDRFSLEKHVSATTPPAFLWHTCADRGVPAENSLLFAAALRRAGVPFELHIFPEGAHGEGLCDGSNGAPRPHNACWIDLAIRWIKDF